MFGSLSLNGLYLLKYEGKKQDVKVISDFISQENRAEFELALSVRPIKLTNAVVVLAFRLLFKVLLKLLKGSKKKNKSV